MTKALRVRDRGTVTHRHAADALLERSGDFVLVNRGVLRSLVLACPDGCGETLTINLDPRTDKAWRYYRKRNQLSVFPSVWRDTGCQSHFIIWHHTILWCDGSDDGEEIVVEDEIELRHRVLPLCTDTWQHFTALAEALEEIPWDVNRICIQLVQKGVLEEGEQKQHGFFRLVEKD